MRWQLLRSVKKRQRHNKNQYVLSARHRCQRCRLQNPICMESVRENTRALRTSSARQLGFGSIIQANLHPSSYQRWLTPKISKCLPFADAHFDRTSKKGAPWLQRSNQVGRLFRFDSLLISTARCSLHGNGIQGIHWLDALCLRSANYLGLRLPPAGTELAGARDSVQQKETHAAQRSRISEFSQSGSNAYITTQAFFLRRAKYMTCCVVPRLAVCWFVMFFVCLHFSRLINLKGLRLCMRCDEESWRPWRFTLFTTTRTGSEV